MRCCAVLLAAAFPLLAADAPMDILEAARKGNAKEIAALLAKGANLEARDKEGRTPLMLAAQYGRTASVRLLLDKGAQPDARDRRRWTAYMLAMLAPSGGMVHTTHDAVLKLLPQPKRFRLAITANWTPGIALFSSCFMGPAEPAQQQPGNVPVTQAHGPGVGPAGRGWRRWGGARSAGYGCAWIHPACPVMRGVCSSLAGACGLTPPVQACRGPLGGCVLELVP